MIKQLRDEAETQVSNLKSSGKLREHFHGKEILSLFLKAHLHATGMSAGIFLYETERHSPAFDLSRKMRRNVTR